jgi:glycosidase
MPTLTSFSALSCPKTHLHNSRSGRQYLRVLFVALALSACGLAAHSQWQTPSVDGIIESGEYGNTSNGTNQIGTNTGQTWCMTWDSTNLYVGITNANLSEGAVIYIGAGGAGSTGGQSYDNTGFSLLPFTAQFVTYFKDGYNEYRTSSGGSWSGPTSNAETYASNSASGPNTREIAIPWSAITGGGIPASFNFFGYLASSGGYVYGQVPNDNPGAFIGTSAQYTQYYAVTSTGNGVSTPPFSDEQPSGFSAADKAGFYHNTFDPFYRSSEGAVPEGTQMTLRFRTLHASGIWGVKLRTYLFDTGSGNTTGPTDVAMGFDQNITVNGTEYDVWKATVTMPSSPTIYYYKFLINRQNTNGFYSDDYVDDYDNLNKDGTGAPSDGEPFDSFQVTVYDPNFQTPAWMATANIYQIFPDRFRNGDPTNDYCVPGSTSGCPSFYGQPPASNIAVTPWNTLLCNPYDSSGSCYNNFGSIFYGGDLKGIQDELDYIQALGFDTLYLNPIFQASSNHRYDTDDFMTVDPALGGNSAFTSLLTELNRRGMKVILDGVFNHASSDSTYFNEYNRFPDLGACQSLSSPYRTWFNFNDNNVPCTTSDYTGWAGVSSLPAFNHTVTAVQNFFYADPTSSVMAYWDRQGANGWRFDVAPDPNFPHSWWVGTRAAAKSYDSSGPLIGEIWPNASQWLAGDQLDSTMNYRFRRNVLGFARGQYGWTDNNDNGNDTILPLTPSQFDTANRAVRDDYPLPANLAMFNLVDSHDTNRALYVLTELGDTGLTQAKQRLELAALFQFTYLGAPTVFYGDEVAINAPSRYSGSNGPVGDPYTRAPYPWPDQPGDPSVYGPPDTGVEAFYTRLGHLRKQHPSLSSGTFVTLLTGDTQQPATAPSTYAYARVAGSETAVVALNNGSSANNPSIPVGAYFADGTTLQDALTGNTYSVSGGNVSLNLAALSGVILLPYPASVDLTAPTGSIALSPAPNGNGWINSSPVSATISAQDSGSGVGQIRYWVDNGPTAVTSASPASASVSGEGQHTVAARAIDNAGNISALISAAVNIDLTPPTVTVTGVTAGAVYSQPPVPACNTTDALSGVATPAAISIQASYGSYTATCSGGQDNAGNVAAPVAVSYTVQSSQIVLSLHGRHDFYPGFADVYVCVTGARHLPNPGASNPGTVELLDNGAVIDTQPLDRNGCEDLPARNLNAGTHVFIVGYSGTASIPSAQSAPLNFTVTQPPPQ